VASFLQFEKVVSISILIIDDEPSVGDALKLVLEANGYNIVLANNGHDGLEHSRKKQFAIVILDLFLTDAYGLELINKIHESQPELPILLITGHGSPEIFAEARRLGAVGALSKPFQPAKILAFVANALEHGPTHDSA